MLFRSLAETRFVAVLPQGHPLASRKRLTLRDLADERFVDTPPGFGNRVVIERAFAAAGIARTVSTVVSDLTEIPRFVAAELGIAVVPELTLDPPPGAVAVPLVGPAVEWQLSVISRPNPSPAVAALLGLFEARATAR